MRVLKLAFPYILALAWMCMTALTLERMASFASVTQRPQVAKKAPLTAPAAREPRTLRAR